jgi:hypothetical protein
VLGSSALAGTILCRVIEDTSSQGCVCRFRVYAPECTPVNRAAHKPETPLLANSERGRRPFFPAL